MSAVASFVVKILLNGNDFTNSSLLNQKREKKPTGSKPTKGKIVTDSVQTLRAKANTQRQTRKAGSSSSPDDDDDDDPKPTWKKKVADSLPNSGQKRTSEKRTKWDNKTGAQWNSQNLKRRATSHGGQTRKRGKWNSVSRKRNAT